MKPVNNKSLLHFIFDQMEKLDTGETTIESAKVQANLAKQANNCFKYELERAKVMMELDLHKAETGREIPFRNAEAVNF